MKEKSGKNRIDWKEQQSTLYDLLKNDSHNIRFVDGVRHRELACKNILKIIFKKMKNLYYSSYKMGLLY